MSANAVHQAKLYGSQQTQLTVDGATNQAPTWSLTGHETIWASDRDGHFELYRRALGGNDVQQLTNNVEDNWPIWGN